MDETRLIRSLRAVRRYADEPIPDEVLRDILDAGRWTGSSKNSQPWEMVVVREPETLDLLAELGRYAGHLKGAAAAIVLVMRSTSPGLNLDAGRLSQNLMLAAWAHGVGSCIASFYPDANENRARAILSVPAERSAHTAIAFGYPRSGESLLLKSSSEDVRAAVTPGRKPLSEIVSWERYGDREATQRPSPPPVSD
jgi:nitroreductase